MNRVVHFEIHAKDMDKMEKFYKDVFGWEFQHLGSEFGNYRLVMNGPGPDEIAGGKVTMENVGINGGMMERKGELPQNGAPVNAFVNVIGITNIDETLAKIVPAGGSMALDKMDVPGVGIVAYCKDPDGNIFGVIQPVMPGQS
jgi:uncharacterized protein